MRDLPTFAAAVQRGVVGDDPLGLAPTNERLYNSAFPGFNNYVRYIRVYSALCWMTKQVTAALSKGAVQTNDEAHQMFEAALEKMELALLWANPVAPALAGRRRAFPSDDSRIELKFETFGPSDATLFAAVTYKPSLTNGLRFLEARASDTYGCLPLGDALANAFDEAAKELPGYRWLKAPDKLTGKASQIASLAEALDVEKPTPAEQTAFLASFFPEVLEEDARNDDKARWLTLHLMLRSVEAVCEANRHAGSDPSATSDEVRACMARGMASNGTSVVDDELAQVQAWWAVLQVRQLQRLCLETLYCVVERWIERSLKGGESRSLDDCVQQLSTAGLAYIREDADASVAQLHAYFIGLQGTCGSLYEAAALADADDGDEDEDEDEDIFTHIARLENVAILEFDEDGDCEGVADAYVGLVLCAVETANLAKNPHALHAMRADVDACSLLRFAEFVERLRSSSVEQFVGQVVKEWVVLRHFEVVASRSIAFDGKNRFRFVVGDYGLERFDWTAPLPTARVSADKLFHALLLCKQADLLSGESAYRLTAAGSRRLR